MLRITPQEGIQLITANFLLAFHVDFAFDDN